MFLVTSAAVVLFHCFSAYSQRSRDSAICKKKNLYVIMCTKKPNSAVCATNILILTKVKCTDF